MSSPATSTEVGYADLPTLQGQELGVGAWSRVEQSQVDIFAEATQDFQWIHVDEERAAEGPFGGTVAHGFLTLSLVPSLISELLTVTDRRLAVNYGLDRIRFTSPVRVGAEIRLRATLVETEARAGGTLLRIGLVVEIRDAEKPALVGEFLTLYYGGDG